LMNTGVVLALRACQRHRPAPRSYPDDRRPQRPDALALGRTDTTIASASSTWTSSATLRANSQTRCHTLLFCTLFLRPLLSRLWTARNLGTGVSPAGRTRLLCGQGGGVLAVVVLPLDWCLVSDHGASASTVVSGFDPVADRDAGLGVGAERGSVDEFFLQRGVERLRWCVVPAHPGSAYGLCDTVGGAQVAVFA